MIAFIDLEFGSIYGSWQRDYVPSELGVVMLDPRTGRIDFASERFYSDIDLVLRKNITDAQGNVVGVSERVANIKQGVFDKAFDRSFRLRPKQKWEARRAGYKQFTHLRSRMSAILSASAVKELVFFGMGEDRVVLSRACFDLSPFQVFDLQERVKKLTKRVFSLDRLALAIDFRVESGRIRSRNFSHPIPTKYQHFMKPHRAICDAARIYLTHKELEHDSDKFLLGSLKYAPPPRRRKAPKAPQVRPTGASSSSGETASEPAI